MHKVQQFAERGAMTNLMNPFFQSVWLVKLKHTHRALLPTRAIDIFVKVDHLGGVLNLPVSFSPRQTVSWLAALILTSTRVGHIHHSLD